MIRPTSGRDGARRRGFTLMEMAIVMAYFSILMTLLSSVVWSAFRIHNSAAASVMDLHTEARLADQFRTDVAAAKETPEFAGDFQASPICFILRGDDDTILLYRFHDRAVERIAMGAGDPITEAFRIAGTDARCDFHRDGRVMSLTLSGPTRGTLTIAAAMKGAEQ